MIRSVGGRIGTRRDDDTPIITALDGMTAEFRAGDRVALIGNNGAGKSTLLRVLAGIYHPTSGSMEYSGRRMPLLDLTQGIDGDATGVETILLRGLVMGLTMQEIRSLETDIAERSGLGDYIHMPIRTYSSGMTMRLLFSIATSVQPDILLMDEWIGTADKEFTGMANERLREIIAQAGILVLASHDLSLLHEMCSSAILMEHGRATMIGPIDEVITHYNNQ